MLCAAAAGPSHLAIAQAPGAVTELRSDPVFTGQVEVPAGKKYVRSLPSAAHFTYARIAGSIQASGGQGNDIRVVVLKDLSVVFDSGRRRSVVLSADFSQPGQYTLVFDNSFSRVSPKFVSGTISIVHSGIDIARTEAERQADVAHYQQATSTIARLYVALKADEQVWGTTQMSEAPRILLRPDATINAFASWATNTIHEIGRASCRERV